VGAGFGLGSASQSHKIFEKVAKCTASFEDLKKNPEVKKRTKEGDRRIIFITP
jgi:hypothetical protein